MKKLAILLLLLGGTLLVGGFVTDFQFRSQAKMGQIIAKTSSDDLFGGGGTPIGAPTEYVISDPKAWGPPDEKGIATIDDAYLKANNIYPTQLKTLVFKSNIAKIAGLGLDFLGTVLLILSVRRKHL